MRFFIGHINAPGRAEFHSHSGLEGEYLEEVRPETFDKYLQVNNPKLRNELMGTKKITRKFYVGSRKMNPLSSDGSHYDEWGKVTLEQAIEHAKEICEETGESQIVVQIVRVIKPQKVPIVVEKL
jgi:hypothetical protein